jgi:hypothetical protein
MLSELQLRWALWAIVVFITLRCLLSMSILLRDRLQDLLVAHVKRAQIEAQKKRRIFELREKIRAKKAKAAAEAAMAAEKVSLEKKGAEKKAA